SLLPHAQQILRDSSCGIVNQGEPGTEAARSSARQRLLGSASELHAQYSNVIVLPEALRGGSYLRRRPALLHQFAGARKAEQVSPPAFDILTLRFDDAVGQQRQPVAGLQWKVHQGE